MVSDSGVAIAGELSRLDEGAIDAELEAGKASSRSKDAGGADGSNRVTAEKNHIKISIALLILRFKMSVPLKLGNFNAQNTSYHSLLIFALTLLH